MTTPVLGPPPAASIADAINSQVSEAFAASTSTSTTTSTISDIQGITSSFGEIMSSSTSDIPTTSSESSTLPDSPTNTTSDISASTSTFGPSAGPTSSSSAGTSAAQSTGSVTSSNAIPSSTLDSGNRNGNDDGSISSNGALIGISVGATIGGILLLAFIVWTFWNRHRKQKRKHALSTIDFAQDRPQHNLYPDVVQYHPQSAYGHSGWVNRDDIGRHDETFSANFSSMDDDAVARARRFSNDGTVATISQTVAGKTNDDYRPQPA